MGTRHLAKWLGIMYTVASLCACALCVRMYVCLFVHGQHYNLSHIVTVDWCCQATNEQSSLTCKVNNRTIINNYCYINS